MDADQRLQSEIVTAGAGSAKIRVIRGSSSTNYIPSDGSRSDSAQCVKKIARPKRPGN